MTSSCGATVIIFLSGFLQGIRQTIDRWFFRHLKSDLFLLDYTESSGLAAPLNPGRNPSLYWLSFETREGNHFWWLCSLPVINLWFWCWMLLMTKQKLMLKIHQLLALTCGVESTTGNNSSAEKYCCITEGTRKSSKRMMKPCGCREGTWEAEWGRRKLPFYIREQEKEMVLFRWCKIE